MNTVITIIPYEGIVFASGEKISFGMSLPDFDLRYPEFRKAKTRWSVERIHGDLTFSFEAEALCYISVSTPADAVVAINDIDLFHTRDVTQKLCKMDRDVREAVGESLLLFLTLGMALIGFHKKGEPRQVLLFPKGYYDQCLADFLPYPRRKPEKITRRFELLPSQGLEHPQLGNIMLGDSKEKLQTQLMGYFEDFQLDKTACRYCQENISIEFDRNGLCNTVWLNTKRFDVYHQDTCVSSSKSISALQEQVPGTRLLPGEPALLIPAWRSVFQPRLQFFYLLDASEYVSYEKILLHQAKKYETQS